MRVRPMRLVATIIGVLALTILTSISSQSLAVNRSEVRAASTFLKGTKWATRAVPKDDIAKFASRAQTRGGTIEINELLIKRGLPLEVREDTLARILVAQGRVARPEAEGWMRRLAGTPGFHDTMSKSMGASAAMTRGHLAELRVADQAAQTNFTVKGIGVKFMDPKKPGGPTDIDILLEKKGRQVAIEAKDYDPTTGVNLIDFRGDIQTLDEFRKANPQGRPLAIFWMLQTPMDPTVMPRLRATARSFDVKLIEGNYVEGLQRILRYLEIAP